MENNPGKVTFNQILKLDATIPLLFTYALGISLVHYLGGDLDIVNLVLGCLMCLLIYELPNFLNAYFDHPESYQSTLNVNDPYREFLLGIKRPLLLQYSLLILTAGATLTAVLIVQKALNGAAILLLGIAWLVYLFIAIPPLRLGKNGYGELIEALFIANFVPSIAFALQGKELPFLLVELTLPLTLIYLAAKIAFSIKEYGFDSMHGRQSLVIRMGWQKAVVLHNILILASFLLLGIFALLGLPWSLTWPILLALPVGGLQVLQMQRISEGEKPKWTLVRWLAMGLFLLMVYFEVISFWL